jgi:hypothetical protein
MGWSPGYLAGYTRLPNLLIASVGRLKLSQEEVVLVYAIESFNFGKELPRPGIDRLAEMIGVDERNIRRTANKLAARIAHSGKPYVEKTYGYRKRITWNLAGLYDDLLRTDLSVLNVDNNLDKSPVRTKTSELDSIQNGRSRPDSSDVSVRTEPLRTDKNVRRRIASGKEFDKKNQKHAIRPGTNPFRSGTHYANNFDAIAAVWREHKGSVPPILTDDFANAFMKLCDDVDISDLLTIMRDRIDDAGSINYLVQVWKDPKSFSSTWA